MSLPAFKCVDDMDNVEIQSYTQSVEAEEHISTVPYPSRKLNLLIVDDSKLNRRFLARAIEKNLKTIYDDRKFDVSAYLSAVEAEDGTEAVALTKAFLSEGNCFDAIFMDNIMIQMHGPFAAIEIRKLGFCGAILGVTGNVMDDDIQAYLRAGANNVLKKPVNEVDLRRELLRIIFMVNYKEKIQMHT
jgi:CheY-like chemotaxis protein